MNTIRLYGYPLNFVLLPDKWAIQAAFIVYRTFPMRASHTHLVSIRTVREDTEYTIVQIETYRLFIMYMWTEVSRDLMV